MKVQYMQDTEIWSHRINEFIIVYDCISIDPLGKKFLFESGDNNNSGLSWKGLQLSNLNLL